jgi:hypothetical protein
MALTGITLSGLEQQVMRVVTVNGRAAASFAQAHPGTPVFGPLTAQRQSMVERLLRGSLDDRRDIRPFADLNRLQLSGASGNDTVAYLIEDPQMQHWPEAAAEVPLSDARHRCLTPIGPLVPSDLGLGRGVVAVLRAVASVFPAPYQTAVLKAIDPLWQVAPAEVYAMTGGCASSAL